jgi:DNA-binding transcriptional ArsR family regulator
MASKQTSSPGYPFSNERIAEYERQLLGTYILGAPISGNIAENVFLSKAYKAIFPVIRELKTRGIELNVAILVSELQKQGLLDVAGGADSVADLTTGVISTVNVEFYEGEVLTAFKGRMIWKVATMAKEAMETGAAPDTVSATLAASIESITASGMHGGEDNGLLFRDLLIRQFPPEDWLVHGLITTGLTVLTGASKIGKSWTALQLVAALDQGGFFLGTLKTRQCDVLYCALEDTPKRIQGRLQKQGVTFFNGSRLETKRRTASDLRAFLKTNPQYRVVIIDTFQKMMGISDLNDYSQTVSGMSAIKDIADSLNIAVIIIHHNRKGGDMDGDHMESALGSTGINATADCTLTMRRKRGSAEASLSVTGRDVEDTAYTLAWNKDICSWTVTESGALKPTLSDAQQQIVDLLENDNRNWTTKEIIEATEKSKQAVNNLLSKMKDSGLIESPLRGQWRAKSKYTNTLSLREDVQVYSENPTEGDILEPPATLIAPVETTAEEIELW